MSYTLFSSPAWSPTNPLTQMVDSPASFLSPVPSQLLASCQATPLEHLFSSAPRPSCRPGRTEVSPGIPCPWGRVQGATRPFGGFVRDSPHNIFSSPAVPTIPIDAQVSCKWLAFPALNCIAWTMLGEPLGALGSPTQGGPRKVYQAIL